MADLLGGLAAGANFATGYQQGVQTNTQNTVNNQMNQLALGDAQLRQQQQKLSMQQQQALSDKAMSLFSTNPTPQGSPVPPAALPGGGDPSQAGAQGDQTDPADKITQLANFAAGSGDLTHANELWTNAANLKNAKFAQEQKQSAMQTADLKRQQLAHAYVAQTLGAASNEQEWNVAKMQVLSNPMTTAEEAKNLANLQYSPDAVRMIRDSGMNSSQQASAKLRELEFSERQRTDDVRQAHMDRQDSEREAHDRAMEEKKTTDAKVGVAKAPTANEIEASTNATKDAIGGDKVDTKDPAFIRARENISARASQIVRDNRAVTYPQAVTMAAAEAKKNGELTSVTSTHASIFGDSTTTKISYKEKGATPDDSIPFTGQAKSELVPGKFYHTGNGLMQWTGTGWKPQN